MIERTDYWSASASRPYGLHTLHGLYPLSIASCRLLKTRKSAGLMDAACLHHG